MNIILPTPVGYYLVFSYQSFYPGVGTCGSHRRTAGVLWGIYPVPPHTGRNQVAYQGHH